ncbi:MAG: folylpolyglutamate synthase/dihydrofolate synthase family protein [Gemmatimonadota bacterium]
MTGYTGARAAIDRLEAFGIRLGLDNMHAVCASLGHPERAVPSVHVAGTNGKGTTVTCLAALGTAHGLRTGRYTSPHVVDLRERICLDGRPIPAADLAAGWSRVGPPVEARRMTYFEATTLIAFDWFARQRVDLAILETGLGGRLDATNVVTPALAVVTGVALDHERHLGADLAAIAREKGGIAKPGVPLLAGAFPDAAAASALAAAAAAAGAPLAHLADEAEWGVQAVAPGRTRFDYASGAARWDGLALPLTGAAFADDAALALRAWERLGAAPPEETAVRRALAATAPPGRTEWQTLDGAPLLLDVAHNPAAVGTLTATLAAVSAGPWAVVAGFLADKAWPAMLDALTSVAGPVWLCGLTTAGEARRLTAASAAGELASREGVTWADDVVSGLAQARSAMAAGAARGILVTGSFHTVGEALVALDRAQPDTPYLTGNVRASWGGRPDGALVGR